VGVTLTPTASCVSAHDRAYAFLPAGGRPCVREGRDVDVEVLLVRVCLGIV